ncbi:hypothetical protein GCM10010918_01400 [Paenibacillus radicis (ex Gao et al. 2016)]|uniref:Uncharacterized protein n=1 Tax=Paenibacillus radicis (ex Gao et al. 2016) TaxID=1737354 RepID=A0A917LR88_9BACL|nr:hypothetical protein GCM10010918_01400 [Paenibacillus radicis (ex Gao et al. 2016)]
MKVTIIESNKKSRLLIDAQECASIPVQSKEGVKDTSRTDSWKAAIEQVQSPVVRAAMKFNSS